MIKVKKVTADEAVREMLELTKAVTMVNDRLRQVISFVLNSHSFFEAYGSSVGTSHAHHAYPGGLPVHTYEVMHAAVDQAFDLDADPRVTLAGAIWHDYGKIYDYDEEGAKTSHASMIRHVARSYAEFYRTAKNNALEDIDIERIGHVILAHHGLREWGSPVTPQTAEARIVHSADMWSMEFGPGR